MEMLIKHEYFCRVFLSHMCLSLSPGTSRCNWIRIIFFRAMGLRYKSCSGGNAEIQLASYVPSSKLLICDWKEVASCAILQFEEKQSFLLARREGSVQRSILISAKFPTKPPISWKGFRISWVPKIPRSWVAVGAKKYVCWNLFQTLKSALNGGRILHPNCCWELNYSKLI